MRAVGGRSVVARIDDQASDAPQRIRAAVKKAGAQGVLAMNGPSGVAAARGLADDPDVTIGSFDLGPDVLNLVKNGKIAFAVDQQAYLQGYLPVVLLAERARYGIFPAQGDVIPTGPNFVTAANADKAIALSARSIR
jgi:simple sugar transport system substrate-binding protein